MSAGPAKGWGEGDVCGREGCTGHIDRHPVENCSCHISPPCSACMEPKNFCPVCGWEEADDIVVEHVNDYVCRTVKATGVYQSYQLRPLDPTKLDWHSKSHTNSSMVKEGVYPEGMARAEVEKAVLGTFGGRFEYFGNGKFKYIAYTD